MKFLAIDIGNVLCTMSPQLFINWLCDQKDINDNYFCTEAKAWDFFKTEHRLHDIGFTTIREDLYKKFNMANYRIDIGVEAWNSILKIDQDVMGALLELKRSENLKIAILSNMGEEHTQLMKTLLSPLYDVAIKHFSCEIGARKPSKLYYQSFLWEHPDFKGCLYLDDLLINIEAGKKAGFNAFQFSVLDDDKLEKLEIIKDIIKNKTISVASDESTDSLI